MKFLYIHGAGASKLSFSRIIDKLPQHNYEFVSYSPDTPISNIISHTETLLTEATVLVGHSLGGVVAASLVNNENVEKIITLSSPFGGIGASILIYMLTRNQMFKDLSPYGSIIRNLKNIYNSQTKPHMAIVTTNGLPIMLEPNDGVVTVASQTCLTGPIYEYLPLNHFEVLFSDETINLMKEFIWKNQQ